MLFRSDDNDIAQPFNLQRNLSIPNLNQNGDQSNHKTLILDSSDSPIYVDGPKKNFASGPLMNVPQFGGQRTKTFEAPNKVGHIPSEVFSIVSNPNEL